jgi:alpha-N-arabinofuranosidase
VPRYDTAAADDVPYLDVAAVLDPAGKAISLFIVNRHPQEEMELAVDLAGFPAARPIEHILIHHPDLKAVNSADRPDVVKPGRQQGTTVEDGRAVTRLKPRSYNLIRLSV